MTTQSLIGTAIFCAALTTAATAGPTQAADIGQQEYSNSCAVCHGTTGKGDGPLSAQMKKSASDLTKIEKNNMGVFPFGRIYEIIDGRETVAAHGPRDMPVWGGVYDTQAVGLAFGLGTPKDLESFTRGRIVALIGYVHSLQAK